MYLNDQKEEVWRYLNFFSLKINKTSYQQNVTQKKMVDNFVEKFPKGSLGPWFLWSFISFQFAYWGEKDFNQRKQIELNWIIGQKAIDRWDNRNKEWQYFTQLFLNKKGITNTLNKNCERISIKDILEKERSLYLNTEAGILHCMMEGLVFNRHSESCKKCTNQNECIC